MRFDLDNLFRDPNDSGGGGNNTEGSGEGQGQGNAESQGSGGTGNGNQNAGGEGASGGQARTFTQAEVNELMGKTRAEEKAKYERAKREAEEAAKAEEAKKQGKFQELYEVEQKRATDLSLKAEAAERFATRLNAVIDGEIKSWPDSVKKLDPGPENVEARSEWLEKSRDLAKELMNSKKAPDGEHGKGSDGKGTDAATVFFKSRYGSVNIPGREKAESK